MTTPTVITAPGVVPVVQIGVSHVYGGAPGAIWDASTWDMPPDLAIWNGSEPLWGDVTCQSIRVESFEGRDRALARWDVGTATIEAVNPDGWADILAGPLVPDALQLRPGRQIRWGVSIDGNNPIWLWRGFIDTHAADYEGRTALTDVVRFDCIDALGEAGRSRVTAPGAPGEPASARITRILNAVDWPAGKRAINESYVPIFADDLDGQALDLLTATADSAGGFVYGDRAGRIVFRHRHWQVWDPMDPPLAVVGNTGGVADVVEGASDVVFSAEADVEFGGDDVAFGVADVVFGADTTVAISDVVFGAMSAAVCPVRYELEFTRAGTTTRSLVNYQGSDVAPRTVNDVAAQSRYGIETQPERLDLLTSSRPALDWVAERIIATQGAATQPRITAVVLDAGTSVEARDLMASINPGGPTRWRCVLQRDGRTVFDRTMFVVGVAHNLDGESWTCRVSLDDAAPWTATGSSWNYAMWDVDGEWAQLGGALTALADSLRALENAS